MQPNAYVPMCIAMRLSKGLDEIFPNPPLSLCVPLLGLEKIGEGEIHLRVCVTFTVSCCTILLLTAVMLLYRPANSVVLFTSYAYEISRYLLFLGMHLLHNSRTSILFVSTAAGDVSCELLVQH